MSPVRLVDREPVVARHQLVDGLAPPPRFRDVRFATYRPDPVEPSQSAAVGTLERFRDEMSAPARSGLFRRGAPPGRPGLYLDGGYGVGKTHLLASLWHDSPGPKAYCTFVELTNLVGALGFAETAEALSAHRLLCVDEFELDDPGDTVLASTLLGRLVGYGVRLAATSNTLPGRQGEDRFAAEDFLREIQGLADHFEVARVDGEDYRHRGLPTAPPPVPADAVAAVADGVPGASLDEFPALCRHLARLHPARYGALVDGIALACWQQVEPLRDQNTALRLVVLADRLYDDDVPVVASGAPLDRLFGEDMLAGGYAKKYRRAISRLVALAREGESLVARRLTA